MIRVNISKYRRIFSVPYYHYKSPYKCTETRSLTETPTYNFDSSSNFSGFIRTVCNYCRKIHFTQLEFGVIMNRKERKEAAERLAKEILELARKRNHEEDNLKK